MVLEARISKFLLASSVLMLLLTGYADMAMGSQVAYVRPDTDLTSGGNWTVVGGTSRWSALNDSVTEHQTPTSADYVTISSGNGPATQMEVGLDSIQLGHATITEAKVWYYTATANSLEVKVRDSSLTLAEQVVSSAGWHSVPVPLSGSQSQLDALRVNFQKLSGSTVRTVYAAFMKLALELPASERDLHIGISANSRSGSPPGNVQDEVVETGATRLREDLEWKSIEPEDDKWTWSAADTLFREAAERDLTILPILNAPPCWAAPGGNADECSRSYPYKDSEYAEFTSEVVKRYGPGGDFWLLHPELEGSLAPVFFEIWNEPYVSFFVNGEVNPARYADLYKAAVIAGRLANPKSKYLVEATWKTDPKETGIQTNWGQAMKAHEPALGTYVDGIAIHPYPGHEDAFYEPSPGIDAGFRNTDRIYAYWKNELGINRPVWITEVGYSSCADDAEDCVPGDTQSQREERKAEWLADLFDVVNRGNYAYVHAIYLYNFEQTLLANSPTTNDSAWFGIRDEAGPLPAWSEFLAAIAAYDGIPVPNSKITGKTEPPPGPRTVLSFTVSDSTAKTECQIDSGSWSTCTSPKEYTGLTKTGHTFRVRGVSDEVTEGSPATLTW